MGAMGNLMGKLTPLLHARNAPFILVLPLFLFYILSLTGCTSASPGIPGLYIVSLNTSSIAPIRVGYFGMCATTSSSSSANGSDAMTCHSTAGSSASSVISALYGSTATTGNGTKSSSSSSSSSHSSSSSSSPDRTALVAAALALQRSVFIPVLAAGGVLFLAGFALVLVHKRDNARLFVNPAGHDVRRLQRALHVRRAMLATLGLAAVLTLTAALATAETAGALAYSAELNAGSKVGIHEGKALQVLQWVTGLLALLFTAAAPWAAGVPTARGKV